MLRITDQYFWNFVFTAFFAVLVVMGSIILQTEGYRPLEEFELLDFILITLATFRLIRLFVYDAITKWFREQFWDAKTVEKQIVLHKPPSGPRRTLADLLSCPWCIGLWVAATLTFFYSLTPYAYFFVVFLAIAGAGTFIQNLSRFISEKVK